MDRRYEPELVSRLRAFQLGPYFSYSLSQGVVPDAIETEVCRRGINKCRARSTSGERSSQRRVFPESFPSIDLREAARLKTRVREFLSESAIYRTLDRGRVQDDATREFARPDGRVRRGDIGERTIDRDCRRSDPDDRYPIVVELVHACYRDIPPALTRTRDPVASLFGARVTRRGERRQGSTTADMRMKMPRMLLFLAIGLLAKVSGLPNGAPRETCSDLIPRHPGGSLQSSYPPYQVLPAAGRGRVRLILGSPQGLAYEGFMILARDIDTGEFVGEFTNLPDSARIVECIQGVKNGVTHTNTNKKHNLEFDWEAPVDYEGTIIFNSTFAQDYSTYWVGVESPRVTVDKRSIDVLTPSTPVTTFRTTTPPYYSRTVNYVTQNEEDPFYTGCHITKNCFGAPAGCIKTKDCAAVVAVIVQGDEYHFELQARREAKYVAVGLSDDKNMGDDSVVECTNEDGEIALHTSWNSGKRNTRHATPEGAIELESASIKNDVIYCKFRRDKLTVIQGRTYDLVNTPYHLLVVAGKDLRRNGVSFHDIVYLGTSTSKKLSDVGEWIPASDLLIRLHGALMLASWIGTASIGMLLARYYRQTWVNSQLCGKDHWFAWHRFFMVLTWSMTIAAFVIIFVELGTWSSETIHASVGLATTILCFIQPFMAAMRPHPGAPRRALFNWAHWFVGNVAKICALIALFFAVRLNKAKLPEWVDWILTAYVVFYVLIHLILTFLGCVSDRQASQRVNSFPMKDMHSRGSMVHPDARRDAPHSGMRKFIFGVYFVVIVAFAATLIVITVLAPIEETWATFTNTFTSN